MLQNTKPSTEPVCFRLDRLNIDTIEEMGKKQYGIDKRATFIRFKMIEMAKEYREKKKNESVNT